MLAVISLLPTRVLATSQPTNNRLEVAPNTEPTKEPSEIDRLYNEAADANTRGDYVNAADLYTRLLRLLPPGEAKRERDRVHVLNDALNAYLQAAASAETGQKLSHIQAAANVARGYQKQSLDPETRDLVNQVEHELQNLTALPSCPEPDIPQCPKCEIAPPQPRLDARSQRIHRIGSRLTLAGAALVVPALAGATWSSVMLVDQRKQLSGIEEDGDAEVEIDDMQDGNRGILAGAIVSGGAAIAAIALMTTGFVLQHKVDRTRDDRVSFGMAPTMGGMAVSLTGRF